jgi:hypothetical protein
LPQPQLVALFEELFEKKRIAMEKRQALFLKPIAGDFQ